MNNDYEEPAVVIVPRDEPTPMDNVLNKIGQLDESLSDLNNSYKDNAKRIAEQELKTSKINSRTFFVEAITALIAIASLIVAIVK